MGMELDLRGLRGFVEENELDNFAPQVRACHQILTDKCGAGNDFLGWLDLPETYDKDEVTRIKEAAKRIGKNSEVLVVIGIGGSYLGARAAIEFINGAYYNRLRSKGIPEIYFVGNNISSDYLADVIGLIGSRDFSINVISKSGTTTEPAIAFRVFKQLAEVRYGREGAKDRIYATTDKEKGALKTLSNGEGYETFVVPNDIGGRFSVMTAVGLLPMAVAGIDIDAFLKGAQDAMIDSKESGSVCEKYAALRNILLHKGKQIEVLVNYDPALVMLGEWFKQLYGESEGKQHKGIFPVSANFSTDLHSIGQFIQDGTRNMFETVIWINQPYANIVLQSEDTDLDGLNYLAGETLHYVNHKAFEGTLVAHIDGGTPNVVISIDRRDEYHLGYLMYFFERACGISGYLLGVNPFDQPGVEMYKKNMFTLLGKPGYEQGRAELEARLK